MRDECARSNHLHTGRWASKGRASAEDESLPAARPLPYTAACRARWFALPPRDRPQTGFAKGDGSKSPPGNCPLDPLPERRSGPPRGVSPARSEEHTSELQSQSNLVCRLLLEKKKTIT